MRSAICWKQLCISVLIFVLLAGCSRNQANPEIQSEAKPIHEYSQPTNGGTINLVTTEEPDTLDLHKSTMSSAESIGAFLGEGLLATDPESLELKPHLAEKVDVSPDGKTLTFKIRSDVVFHDGSKLTSHSFKDTYERILNPETGSTGAKSLLPEKINFTTPDAQTLIIQLDQPSTPLLKYLASTSYLQPLSVAAIQKNGDQYGRNPVGVGAYKFESWKPGQSLTLVRNPDYKWAESNYENQGAARPDKIVVKFIKEAQTIVAALESGSVDIAKMTAKNVKSFRNNPKFQVFETMGKGLGFFLELNVENDILRDLNVRRALNMAVNKQAIIQSVLQGEGVAVDGPLPPNILGYDKNVENYGYKYNPNEAIQLLEKAGWKQNSSGVMEKDGKELRFTLLTIDEWVQAGQLIQGMFKEIGVDLKIQNIEAGSLLEAASNGNFDITVMGFGAEDPDALYRLHSSLIGSRNHSRVADKELDALLEKGRSTVDHNERLNIYSSVQKRVVDQAFWIPIYTEKEFTVVNKRIKGIKMSVEGGLLYHDSWVSEQ